MTESAFMSKIKTFIEQFKKIHSKGLPGEDAQFDMVPITRRTEMKKMQHSSTPKESGVLILFYEKDQEIFTVFMKRTAYDGVHSGQISFPGGKYEETDHSLIETAFREAEEEVGIDRNSTFHIGELTELFIPPSNFNVLPVLAFTEKTPEFKIDKTEVDKLIEVPLSLLFDPGIVKMKEIKTRRNERVVVPCYYIDNEIIWGATAMIVSELNVLLKAINQE